MFEQIFTPNPDAEKPTSIRPRKGVISGMYGINHICLSLPTVVNEKGVLKTVNLAFSDPEKQQLLNSAKVLGEVFDQLNL